MDFPYTFRKLIDIWLHQIKKDVEGIKKWMDPVQEKRGKSPEWGQREICPVPLQPLKQIGAISTVQNRLQDLAEMELTEYLVCGDILR